MQLKSFLDLKQVSVTQAAQELDVNRQYLHDVLRGRYIPGRKLAQRIIKWSQGAVGFNDLWPET